MRKTNDARAMAEGGDDGGVAVPGGDIPTVKLGVPGPAVLVADATSRNKTPAEAPPEVRRYRVTKGGNVRCARLGQRVTIKEGKELDSINFDVRDLQRQGIRLVRVEDVDSKFEYVE
jgi:hypothetical protein